MQYMLLMSVLASLLGTQCFAIHHHHHHYHMLPSHQLLLLKPGSTDYAHVQDVISTLTNNNVNGGGGNVANGDPNDLTAERSRQTPSGMVSAVPGALHIPYDYYKVGGLNEHDEIPRSIDRILNDWYRQYSQQAAPTYQTTIIREQPVVHPRFYPLVIYQPIYSSCAGTGGSLKQQQSQMPVEQESRRFPASQKRYGGESKPTPAKESVTAIHHKSWSKQPKPNNGLMGVDDSTEDGEQGVKEELHMISRYPVMSTLKWKLDETKAAAVGGPSSSNANVVKIDNERLPGNNGLTKEMLLRHPLPDYDDIFGDSDDNDDDMYGDAFKMSRRRTRSKPDGNGQQNREDVKTGQIAKKTGTGQTMEKALTKHDAVN